MGSSRPKMDHLKRDPKKRYCDSSPKTLISHKGVGNFMVCKTYFTLGYFVLGKAAEDLSLYPPPSSELCGRRLLLPVPGSCCVLLLSVVPCPPGQLYLGRHSSIPPYVQSHLRCHCLRGVSLPPVPHLKSLTVVFLEILDSVFLGERSLHRWIYILSP